MSRKKRPRTPPPSARRVRARRRAARGRAAAFQDTLRGLFGDGVPTQSEVAAVVTELPNAEDVSARVIALALSRPLCDPPGAVPFGRRHATACVWHTEHEAATEDRPDRGFIAIARHIIRLAAAGGRHAGATFGVMKYLVGCVCNDFSVPDIKSLEGPLESELVAIATHHPLCRHDAMDAAASVVDQYPVDLEDPGTVLAIVEAFGVAELGEPRFPNVPLPPMVPVGHGALELRPLGGPRACTPYETALAASIGAMFELCQANFATLLRVLMVPTEGAPVLMADAKAGVYRESVKAACVVAGDLRAQDFTLIGTWGGRIRRRIE